MSTVPEWREGGRVETERRHLSVAEKRVTMKRRRRKREQRGQ